MGVEGVGRWAMPKIEVEALGPRHAGHVLGDPLGRRAAELAGVGVEGRRRLDRRPRVELERPPDDFDVVGAPRTGRARARSGACRCSTTGTRRPSRSRPSSPLSTSGEPSGIPRPRHGRTMAESMAWNLAWVSASSASGSESATTPTPANSRARVPVDLGAADADGPLAVRPGRRPSRPARRSDRGRSPRARRSGRGRRRAGGRRAPASAAAPPPARARTAAAATTAPRPGCRGAARWPRSRSTARPPSRGTSTRAAACRAPCRW